MNDPAYLGRACLSKTRYGSEGDALAMAVRRTGKGAPPLRAYPCRICKGWHLTKKPYLGRKDEA